MWGPNDGRHVWKAPLKTLLVQSWLGRRQHPVVPLGLLTVAASMEPCEVEVLDLNVVPDPLQYLTRFLASHRPDTAGISLRNADTTNPFDPFSFIPAFIRQIETVEAAQPGTRVIAGGSGYSLFHQEIREAAPGIVAGTVGHYEHGLPSPRWDLVDLGPYLPFQGNLSIGIEVTRGCDLACSYCVYPSLSGSVKTDKAPEKIRREVSALASRGVNHLFLCAPVLNHSPGRAEEVAEAMAGTGVTWEAYHSPLGFSHRYARLARASGCTVVSFSPDGGTDSDMWALRKNFGTEDMELAVRNASQAGLRVSIGLFPYLSWSSPFSMTMAFFRGRKWGDLAGSNLARLRYGAIRKLPGSRFGPGKPALSGAVPPGEFVLPGRPWMALFRFLRAAFEKRIG